MAKRESAKRKKSAKAEVSKSSASSAKPKKKVAVESINKNPIPGSFKLTAHVFETLKKYWRPLGGILLVYIALNLIFATGLLTNISSNVSSIRNNSHSSLSDGVSGFGDLLTGSGSTGQSTGAQTILLVIESLVIIWALRHLLAGEKVGINPAAFTIDYWLRPSFISPIQYYQQWNFSRHSFHYSVYFTGHVVGLYAQQLDICALHRDTAKYSTS
jgi:hypothetical protein